MNYVKPKKTPKSASAKKPSKSHGWDSVKSFPLVILHTLRGPIIGRMSSADKFTARLFAPAMLMFTPPSAVTYVPVAFTETYVDINLSTLFGRSPVPDLVAKGYEGYFERYAVTGYRMEPVLQLANIPGETHTMSTEAVPVPVVHTGQSPADLEEFNDS